MKKINIIIFTIVIISIFSYSCETDRPPVETIDTNKIITLEDVYKIFNDSAYSIDSDGSMGYLFTDNYYVYGTITLNDANGNLNKEAYMQDDDHGISLYNLKSTQLVNVGDCVRVNLKNVSILDYKNRGKLQLDFTNIDKPKTQIVTIKSGEYLTPYEINYSDILSGEYDCELVKLNDFQFVDTARTYAVLNGTSIQNVIIQNCNGQQITLRNSDYADFAGDTVPSGIGSIEGIISKFEQGTTITWQLVISDIKKVNMDNPRCN